MNVLLGIWALVPWLDRKARRGEYSPGFSDFGVGAILFIAFLTLKAWDLGGGDGELPDPAAVARTCAWILLPITAVATLLRIAVFRHRWFVFSAAVLLHAVLNGLAGLPYLAAGTIAAAFWQRWRSAIRCFAPAAPQRPVEVHPEESARHTATVRVHPRAGRLPRRSPRRTRSRRRRSCARCSRLAVTLAKR